MDEARIRAARQAANNRHSSDKEPEPEPEKPKEKEPREVPQYSSHSNRRRELDTKLKLKKLIAPLVVLVVLVLAGVGGWAAWKSMSGAGLSIDGSKYQAVFLVSGQVYFGKLHPMNGDYMKLTDIFYLQRKETTATDKGLQEAAKQSNDVELIKLGQELHGPQDEMVINKDQILFFENLKPDGKVASTIASYKP